MPAPQSAMPFAPQAVASPAPQAAAAVPLLAIENLSVVFRSDQGPLPAVQGLNLRLESGRTTCLVGESGCGKSLTAKAVLRLLPENALQSGRVLLDGTDLAACAEHELRHVRGQRIGMVFQEPMTALNPVLTVGSQTAEPLRLHLRLSRAAARQEATALLAEVGIPDPHNRYDDYPHQLSGGMRQRVMIAMALACGPRLLLADEPTTALDTTIQGQILRLLAARSRERGMAVLLITHDLGIAAQMAAAVGVMYAGRLVEYAPADELFARPRHPYTQGLLRAAPALRQPGMRRLPTIPGSVPDLRHMPGGCPFHPRCPHALPRCAAEMPPDHAEGAHRVACWLAHGA